MSVPTLPGVTAETVRTDRLTTRVLFSGPEGGIPVLFIHGNFSSATWWEETMLALPPKYRAIGPRTLQQVRVQYCGYSYGARHLSRIARTPLSTPCSRCRSVTHVFRETKRHLRTCRTSHPANGVRPMPCPRSTLATWLSGSSPAIRR